MHHKYPDVMHLDQVVAHLKAHGVAIEEGPVNKQGARGTPRSVCSSTTRSTKYFEGCALALNQSKAATISTVTNNDASPSALQRPADMLGSSRVDSAV